MSLRRKCLHVSDRFFADLFSDGSRTFEVIRDGIPKDARVVDVRFDGFARKFAVLLESDEFDEAEEGTPYPQIEPIMETRTIRFGLLDPGAN